MSKFLSVLILFLGFQAQAGVFVEPFLGYDQSKLKTTTNGGAEGSSTNSGMDYGLKLGYGLSNGLWFGVDYIGGSGKSKGDEAGATESDYSKSAMGALIGYSKGRFSMWAGYGFSDKFTLKESGSADLDITGTNMRIGFGYLAASHVAINFDYVIPKYTKMAQSGNEATISDLYSKFDTSGMMLSVSFPFQLSK
jgi:hypothetical protein